MLPEDFLSFLPPFIRRHLVPLSLGVVGVILIVFSLWALVLPSGRQVAGSKTPENEVIFEAGAESSGGLTQDNSVLGTKDSFDSTQDKSGDSESTKTSSTIAVDVSGAVASPGVIILASNSRVKDAIKAAGGLTEQANNEWIAKNLNLAAKLSDAAKLYVPFVGEQGITSGDTYSSGKAGSGQAGTTGLININTASQAQLEGLSGIGPVTAQKIIANRPYGSVDDLLTKKVVGQSVFGKIKAEVITN